MPPSIRKICTTCNSVHQASGDTCIHCAKVAIKKKALAKSPLCALCGKEKGLDHWSSPYCSGVCANQVVDMSVECSRKVKKAIKDGLIAKLDGTISCVDCGKPADRYDHRDYTEPLMVDPVCPGCNVLRGPAHTMKLAA